MDERIRDAIRLAEEASKQVTGDLRQPCFEVVLRFALDHSLGASPPAAKKGRSAALKGGSQVPTLHDFMAEKKPSNERETALVIAYHREEHLNQDSTAKDDLQAAFSEVGRGTMKRINDPSQVLRDAKRAGYFRSRDRGSFSLTNRGKKVVEEELPGDG